MKKEIEQPMIHPLDKIFRDKLVDHQLQPSATAWNRVSAAAAKKNSLPVFYQTAAALLLLCAITAIVVWINRQEIRPQPVAGTKLAVPQRKALTGRQKDTSSPSNPIRAARIKPRLIPRKKMNDQPLESPLKTEPAVPAVASLEVPAKTPSTTAEDQTPAMASDTKPVVIEFRLDPVNTLAAASPETGKGRKSIRKVLNLAREAKESNPLANLRDAKDDLFALNFKKDKTKNAK